MGRLLGDLSSLLERKVADPKEKTEKLRLAIYSCHDTSLGGILCVLLSSPSGSLLRHSYQERTERL